MLLIRWYINGNILQDFSNPNKIFITLFFLVTSQNSRFLSVLFTIFPVLSYASLPIYLPLFVCLLSAHEATFWKPQNFWAPLLFPPLTIAKVQTDVADMKIRFAISVLSVNRSTSCFFLLLWDLHKSARCLKHYLLTTCTNVGRSQTSDTCVRLLLQTLRAWKLKIAPIEGRLCGASI